MMNKLLLVSTGAVLGFMVIAPVNTLSAQTKVTENAKVTNSQVTNDKVSNTTTSKNGVKNSTTAKKTSKTGVAKAPIPQNKLPYTAKDLKQPRTDVVAMPISFKRSSSISISTKPDEELVEIAQSSTEIAQTGNATSSSPDIIRQQLLIRPITPQTQSVFKQIYTPSLNAGTPVAFGLQTGDAFISVVGATAGRLRDTVDGSISVGAGLGDASQYLAVEGVFNINSIRNFGSNGSFDLKVHRLIYQDDSRQAAIAVGWTNFANYGSNAGGTPSSVYGAATISQLTNPNNAENPQPIVATIGVGGGTYRKSTSSDGVGVFANVGYQFDPQWGVSTAWSGQGLNFGLGFLPDVTFPLNLTLTYSDVTNNSNAGTQVIFGVSYGFNYSGRR
ncbi:hypothetical protein PseudUWO311_17155 [Pseudanabaena sp. UWO311]|uniref:hypothetical protein n=1 Tax=Pseudanabaena sp. UWO311 TaxID=2487337 RepID=UPI0011582B1A|nr:hypothetical protein [Pseudanabaena sp. UWO311]TYQ24892.1 hypothetical protein PseudUWO311_17155 [Pseudanabaena sp. UWO311]